MKIAVIGATGLVGGKMLRILEERNFPVSELIPVASEKSVGGKVRFRGQDYPIHSLIDAVTSKPQIALYSAGGAISLATAGAFARVGCRVIDNSSAWRMNETVKLIVPEINGDTLTVNDYIIANPNCSTIQLVMVLYPLHLKYTIKRVVVSTYQSVSGSGQKGVEELLAQQAGSLSPVLYPHPIYNNVLPQVDVFDTEGYTKEERKMMLETQKIMNAYNIKVSATTVRVPVTACHSESVNIEFERGYDLEEVRQLLAEQPGVVVEDDVMNGKYPLAINAAGKDEVFVGRLRRDNSIENGLNCWIVSDNLRKGAATNAVQIAEVLLKKGLVSATP